MKTNIIIFLITFCALGCKSPEGEKYDFQNDVQVTASESADAEITASQPVEADDSLTADTLRIPIDDIRWLEGRWNYREEGYTNFSIDISVVGKDSIGGRLCCVTRQGLKIDYIDDEPSLRGVFKNGSVDAEFSSSFSSKPFSGRASIYKTGDDKILWQVTKRPERGSEVIENVILSREELPEE